MNRAKVSWRRVGEREKRKNVNKREGKRKGKMKQW